MARTASGSQAALTDSAPASGDAAADGVIDANTTASESRSHVEPSRFRRRLERFRGTTSDSEGFSGSDDEAELKLALMLLREENARLKSTRHQPASPGTAIDRVRVLATSANESEAADDAFSLLGDCLTIREGLDQVCSEIQLALESVRERLDAIATQVEATLAETQDAARLRT